MNRPVYEKPAQLDREREIAAALGAAWKCTPKKLPISYHLDYTLARGDEAFAFAEFKTRAKSLAEVKALGGYLIDLAKIERALSFQQITGLPFFLVVEFTDGVWIATFPNLAQLLPLSAVVRGRADRGDWQDVHPALLLDVAHFTRRLNLNPGPRIPA